MAQITNPNELYDKYGKSTESPYDSLYTTTQKNEVHIYAGKLFYMCDSHRTITPSIIFHPNNIVSFKHVKAIYYLQSIDIIPNMNDIQKPQIVATIINSRDGKTIYKRILKNKKNPFSHTFKFINFDNIKDVQLKKQVIKVSNDNVGIDGLFSNRLLDAHVVVSEKYVTTLIESRIFMDTYISGMFDKINPPKDLSDFLSKTQNIADKVLKGNTNPQSGMVLIHDGTTSWNFIDPPDGTPILKAKKSKTNKVILVKEEELVLPNEIWKATSDDKMMSFDVGAGGTDAFTFFNDLKDYGIVWHDTTSTLSVKDEIVVLKKKRKASPKTIVFAKETDYNIYKSPGVFIKENDNSMGMGKEDYITFKSSSAGTIAPVLEFDNFRPNKIPK